MKKLFAMLLTFAMLLSMIACATINTSDDDEEASDQNNMEEVTIESSVIYDANDIKITAKSLVFDNLLGPMLKVKLENNSDRAMQISTTNFSVNNLMVDALLYCELDAGGTEESEISIMQADLDKGGISVIQTIEFSIRAYDIKTYETIFQSEPLILKTSADESYEQKFNDTGDLLYTDDNIRVIVQGHGKSEYSESHAIYLYIENKSERDWTIQCDSFTINGLAVNPIFSSTICKGKCSYDFISISNEDLAKQNIDTIQTMELSLRVIYWDDYNQTYITDIHTVTFD